MAKYTKKDIDALSGMDAVRLCLYDGYLRECHAKTLLVDYGTWLHLAAKALKVLPFVSRTVEHSILREGDLIMGDTSGFTESRIPTHMKTLAKYKYKSVTGKTIQDDDDDEDREWEELIHNFENSRVKVEDRPKYTFFQEYGEEAA